MLWLKWKLPNLREMLVSWSFGPTRVVVDPKQCFLKLWEKNNSLWGFCRLVQKTNIFRGLHCCTWIMQLSPTRQEENKLFSDVPQSGSTWQRPPAILVWGKTLAGDLSVTNKDVSDHTSNLSRIPRVYPCKFFLVGVNFYRFNAKNWHFRQILREKVAFSTDFTWKIGVFFTDLTRKIGVFRCKFYSTKILPV